MDCLFLYHPNSGRGKIGKKIGYIRKRLGTVYDAVTVEETESAEDLEARVREGAKRYDAILFAGGDGTFNHVLQGLGESDVTLGYLPNGTTNDVARSLGIPRSLKGALNVVLGGHRGRVDCLRVNGRYAMYIAAAGTITSLTYTTPQSVKRALGWFAYFFYGIKNNLNFRVFSIEATNGAETIRTHAVLALVMNGRSVAGFRLNRRASMRDGTIELAVLEQREKPSFFRRLGALFTLAGMFLFGLRRKKGKVSLLRGERFRVHTDPPLVWDFDGEKGTEGDLDVEVLRSHLDLFLPRKNRRSSHS